MDFQREVAARGGVDRAPGVAGSVTRLSGGIGDSDSDDDDDEYTVV
jgi:hypothetical protein